MPDSNRYENGLERGPANHTALTPCDFMARAAEIYPARTAVVHGALRRSYAETYDRCRRLAGALLERGVGLGDTVSVMAPNVPAMLEAHFGVPMAGAVLNALNIRLDSASIAWMLNHARSRRPHRRRRVRGRRGRGAGAAQLPAARGDDRRSY